MFQHIVCLKALSFACETGRVGVVTVMLLSS